VPHTVIVYLYQVFVPGISRWLLRLLVLLTGVSALFYLIRFLKLEISRESQVIPITRNNRVLATANLVLSSEFNSLKVIPAFRYLWCSKSSCKCCLSVVCRRRRKRRDAMKVC